MLKSSDWRRGIEEIRSLGVVNAAKLIVYTLRQRYQLALAHRFDRRFNVDTAGKQALKDFTIREGDRETGHRYEGMYFGMAPHLWKLLPRDKSSFTFVDFGAGKGSAMLMAAELGFRRIVGVEFAEELYRQMQANLRAYRNPRQRCFDLSAVCADAATFDIPDGDCVLFFFNPFDRPVMQKVADNIEASWQRDPRRILIMFYNPTDRSGARDILERMPSFHRSPARIRSLRFRLLSPFDLVLYESDPAPATQRRSRAAQHQPSPDHRYRVAAP